MPKKLFLVHWCFFFNLTTAKITINYGKLNGPIFLLILSLLSPEWVDFEVNFSFVKTFFVAPFFSPLSSVPEWIIKRKLGIKNISYYTWNSISIGSATYFMIFIVVFIDTAPAITEQNDKFWWAPFQQIIQHSYETYQIMVVKSYFLDLRHKRTTPVFLSLSFFYFVCYFTCLGSTDEW